MTTLYCPVSTSGRHDFTGDRCVLCHHTLSNPMSGVASQTAAPDDGAPVSPQEAAQPTRPHAPSSQSFYLTFGVRWADRPHPRGSWIHPDGWVEVVAADYHAAHTVVTDLFGRAWSDLYPEKNAGFDRRHYPRGLLMVVIVADGLIESEDHR